MLLLLYFSFLCFRTYYFPSFGFLAALFSFGYRLLKFLASFIVPLYVFQLYSVIF